MTRIEAKNSCGHILFYSISCLICISFIAISGCNQTGIEGNPQAKIREEPTASTPTADEPTPQLDSVRIDTPIETASNARTPDIGRLKVIAASIVDHMASQFPDDPDALEAKARFYRMIGKLNVAKACWEHALIQSPEYGYAYQGLGDIASRTSDYAGAVNFLLKAVKFMPGDASAAHKLSDAYMKKGDTQDAIRVLELQIALKPDSSDTLQLLGNARLANREYALASEAFKKSLSLSPDNYMSQQGLGAALVRLGKREEAKEWLSLQKLARSVSNVTSNEAQNSERADIAARLNYVARVYLKHGRLESAMEVLQFAAVNEPRDEDSRRLMVKLLQEKKKLNDAIAVAKELTQIAPSNLGYRLTVGTLSQRQKDWATAQESFEHVVQTMPSRPEGYAALAELFIVSGRNLDRALDLAKRVTELRGSGSDFANYSQTLVLNGKLLEAIAAMKVAVSKEPDNPDFSNLLDQLNKSQESR